MPEDPELKLFRDIRECYREAHQAWVSGDRKKSIESLQNAKLKTTHLIFEMGKVLRMKLSKDFTLEEMLESQVARANDITEQWKPPQEVIDNLCDLCEHLLQPLRDAIGGPITVTSGWRCRRLNEMIGGVSSSWHVKGMAADVEYFGPGGNQLVIDKVKELNLPFDQMIDEQHLSWVHLSFSSHGQCRRQMLRMVDGKYEIMT